MTIFLKGILIGFVSLAIPGLGASTIAIILGIYYQMISSISSIFKDFKKNALFLILLILGYCVGGLIGSLIVDTAYNLYPFPLIMAILGFILGSLPRLFQDTKECFKKCANWIVLIVTLAVILVCSLVAVGSNEVTFVEMGLKDYIVLMIVGFITAITLVVPGVDFAVVLLAIGYYYAIIGVIVDVVNLNNIMYNLLILGVYLLGYGIGSFVFSKCIKGLIDKYPDATKVISFAFVIVAPFIVIKKNIFENDNFYIDNSQIVLGIIIFILSFVIIFLIYHFTDPRDKRISAMKKRNLFRLYYSIGSQFFQAVNYLLTMKKIIKKDEMTFEEKYNYGQFVISKINIGGHIYPLVFGEDKLTKEATLYCVNHQGRYDGLGVLTALKDYPCSFLADKSRVNFPFYKELCLMLNSEYIDRSNMREILTTMKRIGKRLENGDSFIVFIEGKYSDNENNLQEFQTGVLHPAYESKVKITPVVLYDTYKVYSKSSLKKIYPEIHFLDPILYSEYKDLNKKELADMLKERMQAKLDEIKKEKNMQQEVEK